MGDGPGYDYMYAQRDREREQEIHDFSELGKQLRDMTYQSCFRHDNKKHARVLDYIETAAILAKDIVKSG